MDTQVSSDIKRTFNRHHAPDATGAQIAWIESNAAAAEHATVRARCEPGKVDDHDEHGGES